jgi:murein DD-endopeptidase MepM/ murein hydrolase activator NlpD
MGTRPAAVLALSVGLVSIAAAQDAVPIPAGVTRTVTWAESHGRECHRYHGRRMCEGPRRVPQPTQEEEVRARELGITSGAARRVLVERPRDAWIAEAGAAATDLGWPVDGGRVWRGFGTHAGIAVGRGGRLRRTRRRQPHEGIDIGAPEGTPILAANEGVVVYSDNGMSGYGNAVLIVHGDGSVTLYGHCSATFVVPGQHVARGEVIAAVGDTGLAHGAHLHFELHVDGQAVDPLPRIAARPGAPAPVADPPGLAPETHLEVSDTHPPADGSETPQELDAP